MRNAKSCTPSGCDHKRKEYLLTGIGRCWVCLEKGGSQVGFRGSMGTKGVQYYRCATLLEKSKKAKDVIMFDDYLVRADVRKQPQMNWEQLIESHTAPTIRAERLEQQVEEMMKSLVIPVSWHAMIAAYFLNNDGMADFERESYNLRRELERLQSLYTDGFISKAKFQEQAMTITSEMKKLEVMEQPDVKQILPYLQDFAKTWSLMTDIEKRSLMRIVFEAIYFDDKAVIRRISAHEPFEQLLGVWKFSLY